MNVRWWLQEKRLQVGRQSEQLGFDSEELGTRVIGLYNAFGPRITSVGAQGAPDVYEQPFHQVDLVLRQELPLGLSLSLKAKNLLDLPRVWTQGEHVVQSGLVGRSFSASLGWRF